MGNKYRCNLVNERRTEHLIVDITAPTPAAARERAEAWAGLQWPGQGWQVPITTPVFECAELPLRVVELGAAGELLQSYGLPQEVVA